MGRAIACTGSRTGSRIFGASIDPDLYFDGRQAGHWPDTTLDQACWIARVKLIPCRHRGAGFVSLTEAFDLVYGHNDRRDGQVAGSVDCMHEEGCPRSQ